jgi:hypothetical protein
MPILTAKARQFIEWGVDEIADHEQRKAWFAWVHANPDMRMPGEAWQSAVGRLPLDVVRVAFFVLEHLARRKRQQLERAGLSEDEIADIDNDLGYIHSLEKFLYEGLPSR